MRRHPIRALALLLSSAPIISTSVALAQAPSPPADAAPAPAPSPPPPLAPAPSELTPNASAPTTTAPGAETAPAAAPAANPPPANPTVAPPPTPTPAAPVAAAPVATPRVAQPKPLPPVVVTFPDAPPPPPAAALPTIAAWLGINTLWIPSDGYDIFADDDALTLFDLGAALSLAGDDALDVAAVISWGAASSEADYRTQSASLDVMRFSAGPELRGSIVDRLYWHGRLSPTATRLDASLDESSSRASLSDSRWAFGLDAAVGLDLRFAEVPTALPHALGFFARIEAGYSWTQSLELELDAGDGDAPVRTQTLALPELALGGPALRVNIGAGF